MNFYFVRFFQATAEQNIVWTEQFTFQSFASGHSRAEQSLNRTVYFPILCFQLLWVSTMLNQRSVWAEHPILLGLSRPQQSRTEFEQSRLLSNPLLPIIMSFHYVNQRRVWAEHPRLLGICGCSQAEQNRAWSEQPVLQRLNRTAWVAWPLDLLNRTGFDRNSLVFAA